MAQRGDELGPSSSRWAEVVQGLSPSPDAPAGPLRPCGLEALQKSLGQVRHTQTNAMYRSCGTGRGRKQSTGKGLGNGELLCLCCHEY